MKTSQPINLGIIGLGHWGPNYLRIFQSLDQATVSMCCDSQKSNIEKVRSQTDARLTKNYRELLDDPNLDAVVVATPAGTHYRIVKDALTAGKDVLAEKPLTLEPEESLDLCRLADHHKKILMVGHTFMFNPGIRKIKEYMENGELGKIYYLNATRTHLGLIRDDVNAIWDLAPHDVSIFNYLLNSTPVTVHAVGACHLTEEREDVAFINMVYPENVITNIHVSWEDSNKERSLRVVGSAARAIFNDLDNLERVKIYKKGVGRERRYDNFGEFQLGYRDGDIISPMLNLYEPLKEMCSHFIDCCRLRSKPFTDGYSGYAVVNVMKTIENEIKRNKIRANRYSQPRSRASSVQQSRPAYGSIRNKLKVISNPAPNPN